jgi:DNA-binding NarL/FixJ family response regulator
LAPDHAREGPFVCFAVRIVVAAPTRERRLELRRAAVSAEWEVVGEADTADEAIEKVVALRARFLVLDVATAAPRPDEVAARLSSLRPRVSLVGVGDVAGAAASVAEDDLAGLRDVLAGLLHDSGDHVH